jgi:predicted dehydrogenase
MKTDSDYSNNARYEVKNLKFEDVVAPYLHGDWEDFDRYFRLNPSRVFYSEGKERESPIIYSIAQHNGDTKLPNITVIPNLTTLESRGLLRPLTVFGCNGGYYHPSSPKGHRIQEVYEFQSYGMMILDRQEGEVELWVAQEGDKVAVPNHCHVTVYNLSDKDNPLIVLDFSDARQSAADDSLVKKCGPILLAYYDDFEVVFTLNRLYVNAPNHAAGVRLSTSLRDDRFRQIRVGRGARLDLGRLLYEELTGNLELIGKFSRLGIRIRQASPEAVLEPLPARRGARLHFSLPLVEATKRETEVYRYFFPKTEVAKPPRRGRRPKPVEAPKGANTSVTLPSFDRPLVIVVEGVGDWVQQAYRDLFRQKRDEGRNLSIFYADDTRWKDRPVWANPKAAGYDLRPWETYLDKADLDEFEKYRNLLPDAVFVVTPDFTHSAVARWWLGRTPTVFIEKPFDSQIKNVDNLLHELGQQRGKTIVLGLDHYQFYALPVYDMKYDIDDHLDGAVAKVVFYLTEKRPIESDRIRSLQYGLTLDLLPHLTALLTYFGDVCSIDEIRVIESGQYSPLKAAPRDGGQMKDISGEFHNETYSRVEFTFQDYSGNGFHIPCMAVVGKGFSEEVKYMEVTGRNGNAVRIDLNREPDPNLFPDYPWDSLFYLQGDQAPLPTGAGIKEVQSPYNSGTTLRILYDPNNPKRFCRPLQRRRYEKLLEDLLMGTNVAVASTLSLNQGREIVRALDRIWWAIQAAKPWIEYPLGQINPEHGPISEQVDALSTLILHERQPGLLDEDIIKTLHSHSGNRQQVRELLEIAHTGPVPTRGPISAKRIEAGANSGSSGPGSIYLSIVVEKLRDQVGDLPVTMLVHGWGSKPAADFIDVLSNFLRRADALWLIPGKELNGSTAPPEIEGSVILSLDRDTDLRIYSNIVADIVFFPGADATEADENHVASITKFQLRARAAIVDNQGLHSKLVAQAGDRMGIVTYCWSGQESLILCKEAETKVGPGEVFSPPSLNDLGRSLKAIARHLERFDDRCRKFRTRIETMIDKHSDQPDFIEDLMRQADKNQWPTWAALSFPRLYTPAKPLVGGRKRALVWNQVLDCVPETYVYEVQAKLWEGQIFEIHMPEETAQFVSSIAKIFEKHLRDNPFSSERSFIGAITNAMQEIELTYPEASRKSLETRKEVLAEDEVISLLPPEHLTD